MNRLLPVALVALGGLAACDDAPPARTEAPTVVEATPAPAEDAPVETAQPEPAAPQPPVDALPPDTRDSDESVKPESETLFY